MPETLNSVISEVENLLQMIAKQGDSKPERKKANQLLDKVDALLRQARVILGEQSQDEIIDAAIASANASLKIGNVRCRIRRPKNGKTLQLRATLPPKPDTGNVTPYQQDIPIKLPATIQGVKEAELQAREVGLALARKTFSWDRYLNPRPDTMEQWFEYVERDYFKSKERNVTTLDTWDNDYAQVYRKIVEEGGELTLNYLRSFIQRHTKPNTSNRKRYVYACRRLAIAVGLDGNEFGDLTGKYKGRKVPNLLLSDADIEADFYRVPNEQWQWSYGVFAAYGLRNHEIFFCDFDEYPLCRVRDGKTKERWAIPLYREWADAWDLKNMKVPSCTGKCFSEYGNRVTTQFGRYRQLGYIRVRAYELRHYLGIRFARCGIHEAMGAKFMGHSSRVHTELYQNFFDQNTALEQLGLIDLRADRPIAPMAQ